MASVLIRDPGITIGAYRILARTDGRFVVFDDRQPPGEMAAAIVDTKDAAVAAAKALVARGCPRNVAREPGPRNG